LAPGIEAGLAAQRRLLATALDAGEDHVGWKVGFGSASGLALLRLDGPVIGHLLGSGRIGNGASVSVGGWSGPVVEAEIAVWIASDIPPGTPPDEVPAHVRAVGPAIELADVDSPPTDVAHVLAGNIFHRHYLLGEPDESLSLSGAERLTARVAHDADLLSVSDPSELTGALAEVLARTALLAPYLGRPVRRDDVVLMGSIIAPRPVVAGDRVEYTLTGFPELSVSFTA
jgi:2-keto-4-pentenoate hydratase